MWDHIRYVGPRRVSGTEGDHMICGTTKEKLIWTPDGGRHKKALLSSKACSNLYVSGFYSRLMCPSL